MKRAGVAVCSAIAIGLAFGAFSVVKLVEETNILRLQLRMERATSSQRLWKLTCLPWKPVEKRSETCTEASKNWGSWYRYWKANLEEHSL